MERYLLISPEHEEIHKSLLEWANWGRNKWHPQTCQSLEGGYRPPPMFEEPAPQFVPNLKQIYAIEALIVSAPRKYGKHLVLYYLKKFPPEAIKKKLHLKRDRMVSHLYDSREYVMRHLK